MKKTSVKILSLIVGVMLIVGLMNLSVGAESAVPGTSPGLAAPRRIIAERESAGCHERKHPDRLVDTSDEPPKHHEV